MSTTQEILDKVLFHKSAIIKNVIAGILMVAILVFEGCFNFATLTWNGDNLLKVAFWVKVATKVILFIAVKTICLLTFLDVARRTNKNLLKQKGLNEKLMKLKGKDFPEYIENVKNRQIKIDCWNQKINNQLRKLEKKALPESRALYFSKDEAKQELKNKNTYCILRKDLEYKKSEEYINANYEYLDITGYPQIDPAVFDTPINAENESKKYQMTSKTKSAITITMLTGICGLIISQTFWGAAGVEKLTDYNFLTIFISMMMDLIFMLWQGFTGINSAFQTINDQEVLPYSNRNRVLQEYIYYKEPDKTDNLKKWIADLEKDVEKEVINPIEQKEVTKPE